MKFVSALVGALSVSSTIALHLPNPATHSDSESHAHLGARSPGGSRSGGSRPPSQGSGGSRHSPSPPQRLSDRAKYNQYLESLREYDDRGGGGAHWTKRDYELSSRPADDSGLTGWHQPARRQPVGVFNGDRLPQHREALDYHYDNYPTHRGEMYETSTGGSSTKSHRKNALKKYDTLPYGLGREETMPASVERGSGITVYPVSKWERDEQGYMLNGAIDRARADKVPLYFENTRSGPRPASPEGVPYVGRRDLGGGYWRAPAYETNDRGQYQSNSGRRYPDYKRQAGISTIQTQEGGAGNPSADNGTTDADVEAFLAAFYTAQGNVTEAIWPIIDDLTAGTNSTDIHNLAWSVYDMALPPMSYNGVFKYGLNSLDWLEDQMAQNMSINSTEYQMAAGYHGYLEELYDNAWANATAAANATGMLDDLNFLAGLSAAFNTSLPSDWNTSASNPSSVNADYFVAWVAGDTANDTEVTSFNQSIINKFTNATVSKRKIEKQANAPVVLPIKK